MINQQQRGQVNGDENNTKKQVKKVIGEKGHRPKFKDTVHSHIRVHVEITRIILKSRRRWKRIRFKVMFM